MHAHNHNHGNNDVKNIKTAFFLNFAFTIIEFIGGVLTNSMAILSDAVHDLGDCITLGFSWYFQKVSKKPRTQDFTYGYKRFSLLGAVINSVILLVGSVVILINAVPRLFNPQQPDVKGMLLLAVLGVVINSIALFRLRKGSSINEKVVSLHMLEDVLGWVAVLIGAGVMYFVDAPIIDPILSIAIALFILVNVFRKAGADGARFNQADLNAAVAQLHAQRIGPGFKRIFTGSVSPASRRGDQAHHRGGHDNPPFAVRQHGGEKAHGELMRPKKVCGELLLQLFPREGL